MCSTIIFAKSHAPAGQAYQRPGTLCNLAVYQPLSLVLIISTAAQARGQPSFIQSFMSGNASTERNPVKRLVLVCIIRVRRWRCVLSLFATTWCHCNVPFLLCRSKQCIMQAPHAAEPAHDSTACTLACMCVPDRRIRVAPNCRVCTAAAAWWCAGCGINATFALSLH